MSLWQIGADKANGLGAYIFGKAWPSISGAAYFAILFCGARQARDGVVLTVQEQGHLQLSLCIVLSSSLWKLTRIGFLALQLIAFFYVVWFVYRMEHGHRRAFLLQYHIDPDTCNFSHATYFDVAFLAANVMVITGTMTSELLDLYQCSMPIGQQLVGNCTLPPVLPPA